MRRTLMIMIAFFGFHALTLAQDVPKVELFGGYSLIRVDTQGESAIARNYNGWTASISGTATSWLSIVGDISGQYGPPVPNADLSVYSFLFGPKFAFRGNGRVTPFVQSLFGASRFKVSSGSMSDSENGFAMALGGGLDLKLTKTIALRPVQFEYLMTRIGDDSERMDNLRFSAGLVFRFGSR